MDIRSLLLKNMPEEELEEKLKTKTESFHGLITREVAMRMLAKELKLIEKKAYRILEIPKGERGLTIFGKVEKIYPVAEYRSGKKSRVLLLKDDTGKIPVVLWNDDIKVFNKLRVGDEIEARRVYEKNNELHLGFSGEIVIINSAQFTPLNSIPEEGRVNVRGMIESTGGFRGQNFFFLLNDGSSESRCRITEDAARGKFLEKGHELIVENAKVSPGFLDLDSSTRILARKKENIVAGKINKIEMKDDSLYVEIGDKNFTLNRENALKFLKAAVSKDISLSTIVSLKKDSLLNSNVSLKIKKEKGEYVIER